MPVFASLRAKATCPLGRVLTVLLPFAASPAPAQPTRGTRGLTRLPFTAENLTSRPITCMIAAAHWYSVDLGTVRPSETLREDLWVSPATGEMFVLNSLQDRLPVEALWCGFLDRAWVTRSAVAIEHKAGGTVRPIHLRCRDGQEKLLCGADG